MNMEKMTVGEIEKQLFQNDSVDQVFFEYVKLDERKGVQRLLQKWQKQEQLKQKLHEHFITMTSFERKLRAEGFQMIAGIDEAGRGPLAGPVVAGAVILPESFYLPGLNDSKQLSDAKKDHFFEVINEQALGVGVGIISSAEIDEINILQATKKAMISAIGQLGLTPDYLLVDAVKLATPYPSEALIKGDARSISIAAASVIAKVTRDRLMKKMSKEYPEYGFEANMGYGTAEHLKAIQEHGITPIHRKTFAPVKQCLEN